MGKSKKLSVKGKLALWYSGFVVVMFLAVSLAGYFLLRAHLYGNLDESLTKLAEAYESVFFSRNKAFLAENPDESHFRLYNSILAPHKYYHAVIFEANKDSASIIYYSSSPIKPLKQRGGLSKKDIDSEIVELLSGMDFEEGSLLKFNADIENHDLRIAAAKNRGVVTSVAYSLGRVNGVLNNLLMILAIAAPIVIVLSGLGGALIAKRSMKPVQQISNSLKKITASKLNNRVPDIHADKEILSLVEIINGLLARLEDSFARIKQFTSDASHELKTPLTILRGELEIALHSGRTNEEYQRIVASALEEVMRLNNVVLTLLDLSRADSGQIQMDFKKHDISALLSDISEDAEILAESKQIRLKTDLAKGIEIECDAQRLHQAFLNVIDNAIKYTPEHGSIEIKLNKKGDYAIVEVIDNGIGISEEKLPKIFNRFYRLEKARRSAIQGSGLGLSIVKWIVDAHNGKIEVISDNKKGAAFKIFLPESINEPPN